MIFKILCPIKKIIKLTHIKCFLQIILVLVYIFLIFVNNIKLMKYLKYKSSINHLYFDFSNIY
jgi:hypothetical protein